MDYRTFFRIVVVLISALVLEGCGANFASIFRDFETNNKSVTIDAKQRVVVFSTKGPALVCAEPSPDALSAISAAFAGSGSSQEVSAQVSGSIAEVASNIGLRTQTIQLLRDGMYRSCEAYMNGALTKEEFKDEQRRYQVLMAGLMAIEQLTGVVTPKQVILYGSSAASTGKDLLQAQKNLEEAKGNLQAAQKEAKDKQKILDDDTKSLNDYKASLDKNPTKWTSEQKDKVKTLQDQVTADQNKLEEKKQAVKNAQDTVEKVEALLEQAKSVSTKASTGGTIDTGPSIRQASTFTEKNNDNMIAAVRHIVDNTFQPDLAYECIDIYKNPDKLKKLMDMAIAKEVPPKTGQTITSLNELCTAVFNRNAARYNLTR